MSPGEARGQGSAAAGEAIEPPSGDACQPGSYTIAEGDIPIRVAEKFDVTVDGSLTGVRVNDERGGRGTALIARPARSYMPGLTVSGSRNPINRCGR